MTESLTGKRVIWEDMLEITKSSPEGKRYEAFGKNYVDFFRFYLAEFPGAYPLQRVRLSQKVRNFLESSRPDPVKIPFYEAKTKMFGDEELVLSDTEPLGKPLLRVRLKKDAGKECQPYIDFYPSKEIIVLYDAEINRGYNELVFTPDIKSWAGVCSEEDVERRILGNLGLSIVRAAFPQQIRVEHLVGYDGYPYEKELDSRGYPKWELSEVPIARVSFDSEPVASELNGNKATQSD